MDKHISRRDMLRVAGAALVGAAAAACGGTPAPTPTPQVIIKEVTKEVVKEVPKEVTKVVEVQKEVTKVATVVVQGKRTAVKVLHFYGDGPRRNVFDEFMGGFNRESTAHTAEGIYVPFANITEKMLAGIAANDAPEVVITQGMAQPTDFAQEKQCIAIDEYLAKSKLPALDNKNWVPYSVQEGWTVYQGKKWGIPWSPDTRFLMMDVDAFEKVGLDVNKPPLTWDDLFVAADKLDKGAKGKWDVIGFCPIWGNSYLWQYMWSMGYDFLDKQDADKIPLIDQPQVRETINWFLKWRDRYGKPDLDGFRTAFTGTTDAYVAGKNPMQVHGVWMPARYALNQPKFRQAWALHPKHTSPNATHASWGDGAALIIPVKCKNPAGGWEWIEYVESLENQVRWCTVTGYYSGQLGPMKDARVPKAAGAHWPLAVQQLELTKARRNFSGVDVHYQVHTAMLDVWDGKKTLDQSLKDKQAEIKTAILDWRKTHPGMI